MSGQPDASDRSDGSVVPGAGPGQADVLARHLGMPAGVHRDRAALSWLLARAGRAGSSAAKLPVLVSALAAFDVADPAAVIESAAADGEVVTWTRGGDPESALVSPAELAGAEGDIAAAVQRLLVTAAPEHDPGVVLVLGCCADARQLLVAELGAEAGAVVVEQAQLLGARRAAALLGHIPDGGRLVLAGDLQALPTPDPGDVLVDLAGSGIVEVRDTRCPNHPGDPGGGSEPATPGVATPVAFAHAVRAGRLPVPASPDRTLVAVPARDDGECAHRVSQLVTSSLPRAFGVAPDEIAVLTPLRRGLAGQRALIETVAGRARVLTVAEAAGETFEAVVAVFPAGAAGTLSRPLVHAAASATCRHLSVVHAAGPALPRAVESVVRRPRTTRLAGLLAEQSVGG